MTNTITFKWSTGNIEIAACAVLDMSAAYLARLVKTATANADEVKAELSAFIQSEIDKLNPKRDYDKRTIEQYKKLLSVVAEKKLDKREKAIMRIVKNVSDSRPQFSGIIHDAGKCCVLDGYKLVRFSAPVDGIDDAPGTFDTVKAIGDKSKYSAALPLPTVKEIKDDMKLAKLAGTDINHIRITRTGKRVDCAYDFGYGLPMVNAKYLIDMLEALPDASAYYNPDYANCNPIYFVSGDDDGILLPVRKIAESLPKQDEKPIEVEKPIEKSVEASAPVQSDAKKELEEERERRCCIAEQEHVARENEIADELAKAEQKIISSGYIENKNLYGKCIFLRLFDKYGIKIAPRSRGWIIDKLKSVKSCADGSATVSRLAARQGEKISQGFCDAYYELRNHLIKLAEEAQAEAEARAQEEAAAVDMPALDRVLAVAATVNDGAHNTKAIADYLNLYCNDMITEDEAKSALLRYTVPLALPAHEEAAQATETPAAVYSVVAVHPAFLARSARLCTHGKRLGFNRVVPGVTLRSLAPPFCILNNTEYHNSA